MLNTLLFREVNYSPSHSFCEFIRNHRIKNLDLSQDFDFEATHHAGINSCDLDIAEERYLLSGSGKGTISIHDLHFVSCKSQHKFKTVSHIDRHHKQAHSHAISRVQWYPHDTGAFTSSGMDKIIKVWDTNEACVVSDFSFSHQVHSHCMSKSLLLIAAAFNNDKIQLLDLKSHSATHKLSGHYKKAVMAVCWSPRNDHHLISAGKDGKVILWDIRKAKSCCLMFDRHNVRTSAASSHSENTAHDGVANGLCMLPDGNHLLSFGTDCCVRLWDANRGKNMLCNYGKIANESKKNVTMSCNGSFAFIPSDKKIFIIDVFKGCQVKTLRGHLDQVNCCTYRAYTQELISGSKDRNILYWSVNRGPFEEKESSSIDAGLAVHPLAQDDWSEDET